MTTLTLHKLPEGFIVTSDEEYKDKDFVLLPITFDLRRCVNGTTFIEGTKKVIAQQDQIDFSALTEEEQKQIGWFDVADLAHKNLEDYFGTDLTLTENGLKWIEGFQIGFQKSQELLSDRRFTLEEARKIYYQGHKSGLGSENSMTFEQTIQSLSQPKSWTIEVEMEYRDMMGMWISKPTILEHLDRPSRPKFTNGKLKVTKIL